MTAFNETFALFPSAEYSTRVTLANVYLFMESFSLNFATADFYISFLGVILTIFHLVILTRKSMRTSSIMSIMICTALCDLVSMITAIGSRDIVLNFEVQDCTPPLSLLAYHVFSVVQTIRDDFLRCSTWLSVSMALIRYLALKLATKGGSQRISSFMFGFHVFGASFLVSTLFSVMFFFRVKIVLVGEWIPADYCPDLSFPAQLIYDTIPSDLFISNNGAVLRIFMFFNATLSKILPCILFPVLTVLLVLALKTTESNRKVSNVPDKKNKTERTTGLVIFMTVTFFIALLPSGIITSLQAVYTDVGFLYMSTYVDIICSSLLTLNGTFHCFICFAMSSQYRKTVKDLLGMSGKKDSMSIVDS